MSKVRANNWANRLDTKSVSMDEVFAMPRTMANYTELRAYTGNAKTVILTDPGIGGTFVKLDAPATDDGGITIGNYRRQYSGIPSITWWGAKEGNAYDITQACQDAANAVAALGGGAVLVPPGTWRKADTTTSVKVPSKVAFVGCGDASVLFFDDRPENTVRVEMFDFGLTIDCALRDLRILGTLKTYPTETGQKNPIVGTNVRNFRMQNVTFDSLRFMATNFNYVRGAVVTGCTLRDIMRDGIRMTHSQDVKVIGNDFERVADDAIALHMFDSSTPAPGAGLVVANNTFEFCQGIKILGAKVLAVHDNTFKRSIRLPIVIASDYDGEGNTPMFSIDVHDNHIIDTFNNYRSTVAPYAIKMTFRKLSAGALSTRPGVNSSVLPYNWVNDNDAVGAVNSGSWGIRVHDNHISTTINATGQLLSTLGFGTVLDRKGGSPDEGYFDPVLAAGFFDVHGIYVNGPVRALSLKGNTFSGGGSGKAAIIVDANDSTAVIEDLKIVDNVISDWPGIGLDLTRTSIQARYAMIRGNSFNLDPLFRHADHNADNTWSSTANCIAIKTGGSGLSGFADSNDFAHCGSIIDTTTRLTWGKGNTVMWEPAATGTGLDDNAGNKGVRMIPSAIRFTHIIYNGDPSSASFKSVTTTPRSATSAMPTSGTYVYGHIVENSSPVVVSNYIVIGWMRMTTGSAHVLNTDWRELRVPIA